MATSTSRAKTSSSARTDPLDVLIAKYNKKWGDGTIITADNVPEVQHVSSGSLAFDVALNGGWVVNQWNEVIGQPSHGKTALVMKTVATQQAVNPEHRTVWVASEHYVPEWATAIGVDNKRVKIVDTNVMERAYEVCVEALDNRACDLIVIDSLADLTPEGEDDATFDQWQVGLGARLTNKFMRKSSAAGRRSMIEPDRPCTGIIVNQWRYKIGVTQGDNRTTPNGAQKDFSYFTRVEVRRDEWLTDAKKRRVGISMKCKAIKNKAGPVERVAQLTLYFDKAPGFRAGEFDIANEIAVLAVNEGVVDGAGTAWLKYEGQRWNGGAAFAASVREDLDLQRSLWEGVLAATGVSTPPQHAPKRAREAPRKATAARKGVRLGSGGG